MCGIVACILKDDKKAAPVLLESIRKLEYRGYDSVGLATISNDTLYLKKGKGKIDDLSSEGFKDLPGNIGIAHVRWATHGIPSTENAHPHTDSKNNIAVVHNGIIENYNELKFKLEKEGHEFESETDTEVIPHLLEKFTDTGLSLEEALNETIKVIQGSYAFVAISKEEPNNLVAVRNKSPLIVGVSDNEFYIASDVPAILKYTRDVIYVDDEETLVLDNQGPVFKDFDGNIVEHEITKIDWDESMAEKGGYDHFMIKEIHETASAVENTLIEKDRIKEMVDDMGEIKRVCFLACGTSYHAALTGKYLLENLGGIPTEVVLASEFSFHVPTLDENTLVISISQSGETRDTLNALELAKNRSKTMTIVNVLGSSMTRMVDYVIYTKAGPEIAVAATKSYLSQLTAVYLFSAILTKNDELLNQLDAVPGFIEDALNCENDMRHIGIKYKYSDDFFFIGRGYTYPTALEGALKLKEVSYIHSEGYAAGELKHGPLALVNNLFPVVAIVPPGSSYLKTLSNIEEIVARGSDLVSIGPKKQELIEISSDIVYMDENIPEILAPLVYVIPLQFLSYYIAVLRGLDPDKPRNLAKCVTVE